MTVKLFCALSGQRAGAAGLRRYHSWKDGKHDMTKCGVGETAGYSITNKLAAQMLPQRKMWTMENVTSAKHTAEGHTSTVGMYLRCLRCTASSCNHNAQVMMHALARVRCLSHNAQSHERECTRTRTITAHVDVLASYVTAYSQERPQMLLATEDLRPASTTLGY